MAQKYFRAMALTSAFLALLAAGPALAQEKTTIGGACTTGQAASDWDAIMQCVSSVWKRAAIWVGSSADTCDASHAGIIQWTGSAMQFCNGSAWTAIGGSGGALGTAASTTSPSRSGDATTGLYSATATSVSVAIAGSQKLDVNSAGVTAANLTSTTATITTGTVSALNSTTIAASSTASFLGNVGVGTTSPLSKLHLVGPVSDTAGSNLTLNLNNLCGWRMGSTTNGMHLDCYEGASWYNPLSLIRTTGFVGIGTSSPSYMLDVMGSVRVQYPAGHEIRFESSALSSTNKALRIVQDSGAAFTRVSNVGDTIHYMVFQMDTGNVGIGTTTGTYKLNVAGTINATGLYVNGTAVGGGYANCGSYRDMQIWGTNQYNCACETWCSQYQCQNGSNVEIGRFRGGLCGSSSS